MTKKCEFAEFKDGIQICHITNKECIYSFLFPDALDCYEQTRIYPEYSYIKERLKKIRNSSFYNNFGKGSVNIKGKYITLSKKGYVINGKKEYYTEDELIKKLLKN